MREAFLTGTYLKPAVLLKFNVRGRTLRGKRMSLIDWVKTLPGRHWDAKQRAWVVTGLGANPTQILDEQDFEIDLHTYATDPSLEGVESLEELVDPVLRRFPRRPHVVLVRPRLAGFHLARQRLGAGATWDKSTGRFELPLGDVLDAEGNVRTGLIIPDDLPAAAAELRARPKRIQGVSSLAANPSFDPDNPALEVVGDVPEWFGLDLYPFQRSGAIAAAGGHSSIMDEPGLGKTRSSLAAHAIRGTKRLLVITPPVAITHWQREAAMSRVTTGGLKPEADAVVVLPARKQPEFPDTGVVIVSDSLLAGRQALAQDIRAWEPDGVIVDEAHRAKTWESKRSTVVRDVATRVGKGLRVAITGTPMSANP
ncbi:MAG TPA: SNF2-related protein, partial [Beutenbergiaceae bacterium]|nr:SNF2-related protein [Beutenbergiaceae bacterium]